MADCSKLDKLIKIVQVVMASNVPKFINFWVCQQQTLLENCGEKFFKMKLGSWQVH